MSIPAVRIDEPYKMMVWALPIVSLITVVENSVQAPPMCFPFELAFPALTGDKLLPFMYCNLFDPSVNLKFRN